MGGLACLLGVPVSYTAGMKTDNHPLHLASQGYDKYSAYKRAPFALLQSLQLLSVIVAVAQAPAVLRLPAASGSPLPLAQRLTQKMSRWRYKTHKY